MNLQALKNGDHDEVRRAIDELQLKSYAQSVVSRFMGALYPAHICSVAMDSIRVLFVQAIQTCPDVDSIRPMLFVIAKRQAINFLNEAYRKRAQPLDPELPGLERLSAQARVDRFEILGEVVAEGLGLQAFELEQVVGLFVAEAGLGPTEELLLREHIVLGVTQEEFALTHRVPLSSIGGIKNRLLIKMRRLVVRLSGSEIRSEILEILRRNMPLRRI